MAKGHLCPLCHSYTVQPQSTNKMKCSSCKTVFDKKHITSR